MKSPPVQYSDSEARDGRRGLHRRPHRALVRFSPDGLVGRAGSVTVMVALPALREVLAGRDFRRLFGVRLVGQYGDGLLQAALATFVLFSPERQPNTTECGD